MKSYFEWYDKTCHELEKNIRRQLEQHYDSATVCALEREFIMYDSYETGGTVKMGSPAGFFINGYVIWLDR